MSFSLYLHYKPAVKGKSESFGITYFKERYRPNLSRNPKIVGNGVLVPYPEKEFRKPMVAYVTKAMKDIIDNMTVHQLQTDETLTERLLDACILYKLTYPEHFL